MLSARRRASLAASTKAAMLADLIAIGYPDETTAIQAEEEAQRLAKELIIQPDAFAAIVRTKDGKFKVTTKAVEALSKYGERS